MPSAPRGSMAATIRPCRPAAVPPPPCRASRSSRESFSDIQTPSLSRETEARLRYRDGAFDVVFPGSYVLCAVTAVRIPLDRLRGFAHHVFDGVLIAQPVRPLDGVEHVPGPVVRRVVTQRSGDEIGRAHV